MNITPVTKNELTEIDVIQRLGYPSELVEDMGLFEKILEQENTIAYLCFFDEKIAGYVIGYPTDRAQKDFQSGPVPTQNPDMMYLHDLCVHPDYRGKGMSKGLLDAFEKKAKEGKFKGVIATAVNGAIPYWERQGYKAIEDSNYRGTKAARIEKYF
jgi:GNAT superfamily N-acetyltransferase